MDLQEFERLLSEHLPPQRVRRIIRIYIDVVGGEIDPEYDSGPETAEGISMFKQYDG